MAKSSAGAAPKPRRRARPAAEAPEAGYSRPAGRRLRGACRSRHRALQRSGAAHRGGRGARVPVRRVRRRGPAFRARPPGRPPDALRWPGQPHPTLSRLGSPEWRNVKSHVKEAVQEVAEDLLELYAKRSVVEGYRLQRRHRLAAGAGSQLPLYRNRRPDARPGGGQARYGEPAARWTA